MIQKPRVRRDRGRATHLSTQEPVGPSTVWFTEPVEPNDLESVAILRAEARLYKRIADARGEHARRRSTGEWPTVDEWYAHWLERRYGGVWMAKSKGGKKRSADQEVDIRWRLYLQPHLGHLPMDSVRPADIGRVLYQKLADCSDLSVALYRSILRSMWKDAMIHGWDDGKEVIWRAQQNPVASVPRPKIDAKIRRTLTDEQCVAVLRLLEERFGRTHKHTVCVAFQLGLGLRISEIRDMRWHQVVLDPDAIQDAVGYIIWQPGERKARQALRLPLPAELASYLPTERGGPDDFVVPPGGRMEGLNVAIREAAEKLGIDPAGLSGHTFRRSMATNLYLDGFTVDEVRRALGHKHTNTTWGYLQLENAATGVADTVLPRARRLLGGG